MLRKLSLFFFLILPFMLSPHLAIATGEAVLAQTGQYTFFINPHPGSCMIYRQEMVPCVATQTIPIPRRVVETYPVPFPVKRKAPVVVSQEPVGCAFGAGPCVECYPQPSRHKETREIWPPGIKPVSITSPAFTPRHVTRKITRPQWFLVTEHPVMPFPKPIRKVGAGG
jgi:hypothetical protein